MLSFDLSKKVMPHAGCARWAGGAERPGITPPPEAAEVLNLAVHELATIAGAG
jgi:hypothetical protein